MFAERPMTLKSFGYFSKTSKACCPSDPVEPRITMFFIVGIFDEGRGYVKHS